MSASPARESASSPDVVTMRNVIVPRLRSDVPEIAGIYEIGVGVLDGGLVEAHKYILAHIMREIRTRLPLHYGVASVRRFYYSAVVEKFAAKWVVDVSPQLGQVVENSAPTDVIKISREIATGVNVLVEGHKHIPDKIRDLYLRLNEQLNPTTFPATSVGGVIDQWLKLDLHAMAHMPDDAERPFTLSQSLDAWDVMEGYLYYIFAPAHIAYPELDAILEDANAN
jgi:hypothetical protein